MNKRSPLAMAMLAILAGCIVAGVAVAGVMLSGVLTVDTTVSEPAVLSEVAVDTSAVDGMDHENFGANVVQGVTYDLGINLASTGDMGNVVVLYEINGVGIAPEDVSLEYWDYSTSSWATLSPQQDGADMLSGTFGPAEGFALTAGYDLTTYLKITFIEGGFSGDLSTDFWVESA